MTLSVIHASGTVGQMLISYIEGIIVMAFIIAGIVALALLGYLIYVLFHPDKLS